MRAQGRRRTTVIDEILAERVDGYLLGDTPPEDKVIGWVRDAGHDPKPQLWVVANGNRRQIDVALPDDRVAVEYQGIAAHSTQGAVERDSEKITDLQLAGWFVVLVTKKTQKAKFRPRTASAPSRFSAAPDRLLTRFGWTGNRSESKVRMGATSAASQPAEAVGVEEVDEVRRDQGQAVGEEQDAEDHE